MDNDVFLIVVTSRSDYLLPMAIHPIHGRIVWKQLTPSEMVIYVRFNDDYFIAVNLIHLKKYKFLNFLKLLSLSVFLTKYGNNRMF